MITDKRPTSIVESIKDILRRLDILERVGGSSSSGGGSGDVVGDTSSADGDIAVFNGTTGKIIKDGGYTIPQVLDRSNHTGTQTASTISDFDAEVSNNTDVSANTTHRGSTGNPHNTQAGDISITDTGGYYTGADVELALQEIGSGATLDNRYINASGDSVSGDLTMTSGGMHSSAGGSDSTLATAGYIKSRGMNLVTNGFGYLLNNYNFSSTTFDQTDLYAGFGSFSKTSKAAILGDEYISVNPNLFYKGSAWLKSTVLDSNNQAYFGIQCLDADGLVIFPYFTMRYSTAVKTVLTADLKPGDTTMSVADTTGWNNTGAVAYQRQALFFGYQNSFGYTYPDYTYSRYSTYYPAFTNTTGYKSNGFWAIGGISGTTITLTEPWGGTTIPSGTAVQNGDSGGTYKYSFGANIDIPGEWTNLSGVIGGVDDTQINDFQKFHPGTAFVQLLILVGYPSPDTNVTNISSVYFSEINQQNLISSDVEYTTTSSLDTNYTYHRCNSSSNFTLTIGNSSLSYQKIYIRNVNTGTVTLSGSIESTVPTTLASGDKIELYWNKSTNKWE